MMKLLKNWDCVDIELCPFTKPVIKEQWNMYKGWHDKPEYKIDKTYIRFNSNGEVQAHRAENSKQLLVDILNNIPIREKETP